MIVDREDVPLLSCYYVLTIHVYDNRDNDSGALL